MSSILNKKDYRMGEPEIDPGWKQRIKCDLKKFLCFLKTPYPLWLAFVLSFSLSSLDPFNTFAGEPPVILFHISLGLIATARTIRHVFTVEQLSDSLLGLDVLGWMVLIIGLVIFSICCIPLIASFAESGNILWLGIPFGLSVITILAIRDFVKE